MRAISAGLGAIATALVLVAAPVEAANPTYVQPTPTWKKVLMPWSSTTSAPVAAAHTKGRPSQNGRPLWTPTSQSTTMQGLSNTTKKAAQGTMDAVTLKPLRTKMAKGDIPKYSTSRTEKKPGPFGSLFAPAKPQSPQTMKEWMSLDRPKM